MSRYEIADEQWEKIKGYFPGKSDREMLNAILCIAHSGAAGAFEKIFGGVSGD